MVGVVTGIGLGLERSSANVLGPNGLIGVPTQGESGDQVYVNAATGDLVDQRVDQILTGIGPNDVISDTYNNRGTYSPGLGTADGWMADYQRLVKNLTGTVNTAGSTIMRVPGDGSNVTYSYKTTGPYAGSYVGDEGGGAYDTLQFNASTNKWTWTDGATQQKEVYDGANGGRLMTSTDTNGNVITYSYTASQLTSITTTDSGGHQDTTTLVYNGSNQLTSIVTSYWNPQTSSQQTLTAVYYAYDSQGRLSTITTDLSPTDNSISDGKTYVTTYGYASTTPRITSITQSDGSSLTIGYNTANQVTSLIQTAASGVTRTTTFSYAAGQTTVTDPLGIVTLLNTDASGELTSKVVDPTGLNQTTSFTYDTMGDVLSATAPDGTTVNYTYDGSGNRLSQIDAAGNTVTWTYGASNQMLTQTVYLVPKVGSTAASSPETTWYVYDANNNLAYTVSQQGDVTQYLHNALGQQTSVLQFTADAYNTTGMTAATTLPKATMDAWAAGLSDLANTKRTDTTYDFRGNIATVTTYGSDTSTGAGNTAAATEVSQTTYVYDPSGRLVQTLPAAAATAYSYQGTQRLPTDPAGQTYAYDGLGRLLTTTDLTGSTTTTTYAASTRTTVTTLANGLTQTSTYDQAGELISYSQAGPGMTTATTAYKYDADGRLMMVTDPNGNNTYYLYDTLGRKVAEILADGSITEFRFNADNQVNETIQYATLLTSAQLTSLASAAVTAPVAVATVRPAANAADRYSWSVFDSAHRLIETIDGTGAVTVYAYDGASELVSTTAYATLLSSSVVSGFQATPPTALTVPTASPGVDQVTRYFYNSDGLLIGTLNADGFLTETIYDDAGQKAQTIAFATAASQSLWAAGTFAQLLTSVGASASDDHTWYVYDSRGLVRGTVDGDGDVTQYHYTPLGMVDQTITGQQLSVASLLTTPPTLATLTGLSTTGAGISVTNYTYNLNGQVLTKIQSPASGTTYTTAYVYDNDGNVVSATDAAGKVSHFVYDAEGRQIYAVDALGDVTQTTYDADGHVITVRAYAAQVASATLTSWGSQITAAQVTGAVTTSPSDEVTNSVYDADGRLKYSLDANLRLSEYDYDPSGNLVQTIQYAGDVTAAASYTVSYIQGQITSLGLASLAGNRTTRAVYDADNRLAYAIDAMGDVSALSYNAEGQTIKVDQLATLYTTSGVQSLSTMQTWAAANVSAKDRITRTVYDAAGRVAYTVDGAGYITGFAYNAMGEVATQTRYAAAYTVSDGVTQASLATLIGSPTGSEVTSYGYDAAGRLVQTTDPLGIVTQLTLNAQGLVADSVLAYGTTDAADTHYTYDALGRVVTQTLAYGQAEAATTSFTYDALGRVLTSVDGRSNTTTYTYDADGNVLTTKDAVGNTTTNVYNAFGNLVETTDGRGNSGFFYYDLLNRLTLQVDPDGYATATSYTIGNQVASVTRYHLLTTGTPTITTPPTINTSALDEITSFTRDLDDRLTLQTDATGATQSYTYDAFGDQLTATNQLGGVTTYTYDARGLMLSEVLPITSTTAAGATEATSVTNTYAYDGFGNRTQMTEASGLTEQRITTYGYDLDNRLTTTTTPVATTTTTYDRRGNVIEQIDGDGNKTFTYYDHRNDKIAQINALGAYTAWTYDGNGNVLTKTTYGSFVTLPTIPGGAPPSPVNPTIYRLTSYAYDKDNRLTTTTVNSTSTNAIYTGAYNGTAYVASASPVNLVTQTVYDADGNVIQTTDANGASTYYYYDKLGRKIGQVDPNNYLTTYTLDQDGNVTSQTQFATALATGFSTTTLPTGTSNANDRISNFTYDLDGRRLTETRMNVARATISTSGAMTTGTANNTVTYTYNGLGEVTSQVEINGDTTTYTYDTEGRLTAVLAPGRTDSFSTTDPQTLNYYDGLGDLTRTTVGNNGGPVSSDRVTTYTYGPGGQLATMTNGDGFTQTYTDDANGNVLSVAYGRITSAGGTPINEEVVYQYDALGRLIYQANADKSGSTWTYGDSSIEQYDAYGEITGKGVNGAYQQTSTYDGAGRVISSNAANGSTVVYYYDADGHQTLQITSAGTGAVSLAGDSQTAALGLITVGGVVAGGYVAGLAPTITQYDKDGNATKTILPYRQLTSSTTSTLTSTSAYDAFGDMTSQTNALGAQTNYTFNTEGEETSVQQAAVSYTDQTGTIHTGVTPTEYNYYDLSGRLVATKDANGNLTTYLLLSGTGYNGSTTDVIETFQPDAANIEYGYDVFGNQTTVQDQLGRVETKTYDLMGNLLTDTHPADAVNADAALTDFYAYDGLGQRIATTNSELAPSLSVGSYTATTLPGSSVVKETTDYDSQGRVTKSVDYMGNVTTNSYSWNGSLATTGLGTFGGWVQTQVNTAGLTEVEDKDFFGHAVGQTDFGANTYAYNYNAAGELTTQTDSSYQKLAYTYFDTGKIATIVDTGRWVDLRHNGDEYTTTYGYDAEGDKTFENYVDLNVVRHNVGGSSTWTQTSITWENESATYDALGRVVSVTDTPPSGASELPLSIAYEYDQNGNVVHMVSNYTTLGGNGTGSSAPATENYWYTYDSLNRALTSEGVLKTGARGSGIVRGYQGKDIAYDAAGERVSLSTTSVVGGSDNVHTEYYGYTQDGFLASVKLANQTETLGTGTGTAGGTQTVVGTYASDAMGRVTTYYSLTAANPVTGTQETSSTVSTYDNDSDLTKTVDTTVRSGSPNTTTVLTTNDYYGALSGTTYTGAYQGGVVTAQTTTSTVNGTSQPNTSTVNSYIWWTKIEEHQIAYMPNSSGSTTYYSSLYYDPNGYLIEASNGNGTTHTINYLNNAEGEVIYRNDSAGPLQEYYYLGAQTIGDTGDAGPSQTDYASAINEQYQAQGPGAAADFDQNYTAISPTSPGDASTTYTVQSGDTLASIAQQLWGDANLWYLIADANGLTANQSLVAGQNLIIPNDVINLSHTSTSYRAYNATQATGYVEPLAPPPPAQNSSGCGGIGAIIVDIVAAVVTAITAPFVGPLGAILAAAGGDALGQGVAIAVGAQHGFNWSEVALSAITAGVTQGLNALPGVSSIESSITQATGTPFFSGALNNALVSTVTQGIGVATGLQSSFSWAGVAAAGIEGGVGAVIKGPIAQAEQAGTINNVVGTVLTGTAKLIAGGVTRSLISGTDLGQSLQDELPSVIGQTVGNLIGSQQEQAQQQAAAPTDNAAPGTPGFYDTAAAAFDQYEQMQPESGTQADPNYVGPTNVVPPQTVSTVGLASGTQSDQSVDQALSDLWNSGPYVTPGGATPSWPPESIRVSFEPIEVEELPPIGSIAIDPSLTDPLPIISRLNAAFSQQSALQWQQWTSGALDHVGSPTAVSDVAATIEQEDQAAGVGIAGLSAGSVFAAAAAAYAYFTGQGPQAQYQAAQLGAGIGNVVLGLGAAGFPSPLGATSQLEPVYGAAESGALGVGRLGANAVTNVTSIGTDQANAPFLLKGFSAPYDAGQDVFTFTTTSDVNLARVSTLDNPEGAFLVHPEDISGLSADEIQQYLALPKTPTQISNVSVPAGTNVQFGYVAPQPTFAGAPGGAPQYQLLQQIPSSSFGTPRPLP